MYQGNPFWVPILDSLPFISEPRLLPERSGASDGHAGGESHSSLQGFEEARGTCSASFPVCFFGRAHRFGGTSDSHDKGSLLGHFLIQILVLQ